MSPKDYKKQDGFNRPEREGVWQNPLHPSESRAGGFAEPRASFQRGDFQPDRTPQEGLAAKSGLIVHGSLEQFFRRPHLAGARLGARLVSSGYLRAHDFARLLSIQNQTRYVDLECEPIDPTLSNAVDLDHYIEHQYLPWRWINREVVYVATDPARVRAIIEAREGHPCLIYVATPKAIRRAVQERFYEALNDRARLQLVRTSPESSAQHRFSPKQAAVLFALFALIAGLGIVAPRLMALGVSFAFTLCFLSISVLKFASILVGRRLNEFAAPDGPPEDKAGSDQNLPVYTVLVPLFREAAVLPILVDALNRLDYPTANLQILLIFEESDHATIAAAKALKLPDSIEFIRVPHSLPLTKPKACNYALNFARGDYLVVYDAEDLPEPDQLRRALAAFGKSDETLACVQARLNFYNQFENWLTRQFTLEYAAFFDLLLPTLEKLRLPIPLGGTSTHFRTSALRAAGAWDPFNVTEDADLGMRFAMLGLRTGIIHSTTYEEANCRLDNWLRQRSRWVKGWLQTYLVRMRHPVHLWRALGPRGFLGFQVVIGGFCLANLAHPVFYLALSATLLHAYIETGTIASVFHASFTTSVNLSVLTLGYVVSILCGMRAASARGLRPLMLSALSMPAYWLLISWGAYKALFQFISSPSHWEKTEHGISRLWAERHASALRNITYRNEVKPEQDGNSLFRLSGDAGHPQ